MRAYLSAVLLSYMAVGLAKDLPPTFQRCKKTDPSYEQCMVQAINGAFKQMRNGLPEFGILPVDPLTVSTLTIEQGHQSAINLKQDFKNVKLNHLSDSTITKFKFDFDRYTMRSEAFTPYMEFVGEYKMDGRVLLLPVTGRGLSNVTLHGMKTKHELICEPISKKGETYLRVKKYNVKFEEPKFMTLQFDNLFNGDKQLGTTLNKVLNENWKMMFNELRGAYEDTFGYIFRDISNKLFLKVPMNRIFLD